MNTVTFPLLNLKLDIEPIAFEMFGIEIHWYALLIVSAIIIALIILKIRDGLYDIKFSDIVDLAVYVIPISIISARLYYVIFNLKDYINSPVEILNIRNGGLAIYGGIIGGLVTCVVFCKKRNIKLLNLLDCIVPVLALRASNRTMGKFCKHRSIWCTNYITLENGDIRIRGIYRSTSNIFL